MLIGPRPETVADDPEMAKKLPDAEWQRATKWPAGAPICNLRCGRGENRVVLVLLGESSKKMLRSLKSPKRISASDGGE